MQLHPTRSAVDLTIAGAALVALGTLLGQAAVVAWGGALLLGLQIARSVTLLGVSRIRAAGFEMLWREKERVRRVSCEQVVKLEAEVRNRDDRAARYVHLRSLHSPHLRVKLEPPAGEVPAGGRLAVTVELRCKRVGRHGFFGLSLEVQGSPGLYEVPLTFSNPFGIEAMPPSYATRTRSAIGGRNRSRSDAVSIGRRHGGNYDLREIREYMMGDPFKRIAWKASARRGQLMVREFDLEERDVVWLILDASVELWSGIDGQSPLDLAIQEVAAIAERHLEAGDQVGLAVVAARRLNWLPPGAGPKQASQIMEALSFTTGTYDTDRSAYDESEVCSLVLEHLRALDPNLARGLHSRQLDHVARRSVRALNRAPFNVDSPFAMSRREQSLRRYLLAFGLSAPPRLEPDRPRTDLHLAQTLKDVVLGKPKASVVCVWSPLPDPSQQQNLLSAIQAVPKRRCRINWYPMKLATGFDSPNRPVADAARFAVTLRAQATDTRGRRSLSQLGIKVAARPLRSTPHRKSAA